MFGGGRFTGFLFGTLSRAAPGPAEIRNSGALGEMATDKTRAEEDSRYDAMTDAQRDAYYVNPSLWTRISKRVRGR
jgi:hypothetical protein